MAFKGVLVSISGILGRFSNSGILGHFWAPLPAAPSRQLLFGVPDPIFQPDLDREADWDERWEDETVCAICFTGPRDAVLLECGHGGICYACAKRCLRKKARECPYHKKDKRRRYYTSQPRHTQDGIRRHTMREDAPVSIDAEREIVRW